MSSTANFNPSRDLESNVPQTFYLPPERSRIAPAAESAGEAPSPRPGQPKTCLGCFLTNSPIDLHDRVSLITRTLCLPTEGPIDGTVPTKELLEAFEGEGRNGSSTKCVR